MNVTVGSVVQLSSESSSTIPISTKVVSTAKLEVPQASEPQKSTEPESLTDAQIDEVLFPDLSKDCFSIVGKQFRIRVLPWKWERQFRRVCLPIVETELKPVERVIHMLANDLHLVQNLDMTHLFAESEIDIDSHLTDCVVVICMSQDEEVLKLAALGQEMPIDQQVAIEKKYRVMVENAEWADCPSPRQYLREIVRRQQEKMKLVDLLGKSLIARFGELSNLIGTRKEFDSLKQGLSQQARSYMAKAGKVAGIPAKSSSQSTDSGSENKQPETP